ncbi:MAG: type II toxin-antitoxin system RelE/ParE family toxin [Devosiaceae bacterium]|nr:type II toxin-antitoxin system RelE/ParE family toxin [Devosiaceae bacterium]
MTYKIFRHKEVEQDLFDIVDLLLEYAGSVIAEKKLLEIEISIKKLAHTPHIGTIRDDIFLGCRAIATARKGVITFNVDDAKREVFIICITYAGVDWIARSEQR